MYSLKELRNARGLRSVISAVNAALLDEGCAADRGAVSDVVALMANADVGARVAAGNLRSASDRAGSPGAVVEVRFSSTLRSAVGGSTSRNVLQTVTSAVMMTV